MVLEENDELEVHLCISESCQPGSCEKVTSVSDGVTWLASKCASHGDSLVIRHPDPEKTFEICEVQVIGHPYSLPTILT